MLCIFLSGFCNAIMDTVDHHFHDSIFSLIENFNKRMWWNESQGWLNKYNNRDMRLGRRKIEVLGLRFNYPVQLTDAWHFFKTLMLVFCSFGIAEGILYYTLFPLVAWYWYILGCAIVFCISWVLGFNLGYNKLLLKKTWTNS